MNLLRFAIGKLLSIRLIFYHNLGLGGGPNFRWQYRPKVKFIVEIKLENEREEIIPIYPWDYEIKKFRNFDLTQETLSSKETLEAFLHQQIIEGSLNCTNINVHDAEAWREEAYKNHYKEIIEAEYQNWFVYFVICRIYTIASDFKSKLLQRKNRKKQRKKSE